RQVCGSTSQEDTCLLKELTHGTHTHYRFLAFAPFDLNQVVAFVQLAPGKCVIASHELKLWISFYPENLRVFFIFQEDYRCCVSWCNGHVPEYSMRDVFQRRLISVAELRHIVI